MCAVTGTGTVLINTIRVSSLNISVVLLCENFYESL